MKHTSCYRCALAVGMVLISVASASAAGRRGPALVDDTGQAVCWDADINEIPCAGTGHDGDLQAGVEWPTPRFTDNGDGTISDKLTGLMWLKDANCFGKMRWQPALDRITEFNTVWGACADYAPLTFTDWHLPNVKELLSLVDYGERHPALPPDHPFSNIQLWVYWASSSHFFFGRSIAWAVELEEGSVLSFSKTPNEFHVWPVRVERSTSRRGASRVRAPVEDTGQDTCWDAGGNEVACAGTGQDGELQAGVDWPSHRLRDNGDGTAGDRLTGLIWLKDADCFGTQNWQGALDSVVALNTTSIACGDYTPETFSDWRLPNIKELLSLIDYSRKFPALPRSQPFLNMDADSYWSSSTLAVRGSAWTVDMKSGELETKSKGAGLAHVWPVRGGQ